MDRAVRAVKDDHAEGIEPDNLGSELVFRVCRLDSVDQSGGSEPETPVLSTSRVTKEVIEDQEEGRVPVIEVTPLIFR